jgi:acetyltransferase-like isoleucine patch superfamily enzyme
LVYGTKVRVGQWTRVDLPQHSIVDLGDNVSVSRSVHIVPESDRRIVVGAGTTIQDDCRIYGDVTIGRRCIFAPNAFVSSGTHAYANRPCWPIQEQDRLAPVPGRPIRIFGDCWFGINSVLLPGVTIGRGCVVGANSVVNDDLPPFSVAVGNPARIVKQRLAFAPKSQIMAADEHDWPYFYDGFDLSLNAGETDFYANSDFVLVLEHPRPRAIRLHLSAGRGQIGFSDRGQTMSRGSHCVEFELQADRVDMPFLRFQVDGECRIRCAELV